MESTSCRWHPKRYEGGILKLKWGIISLPSFITEIQVFDAFQHWKAHFLVDFTHTPPSKADILFQVTDCSTFTVLANAELPQVDKPYQQLRILLRKNGWHRIHPYRVLLHEIGHSLGLPHVDQPKSVMHGNYSKSAEIFSDADFECAVGKLLRRT